MATLKLTASTYYLSNTSYLSVSNVSNMYTDTDSETYATVTNSQNGTTSYYLYIRGFNFGALPEGAIVNSFSIKLKAREQGGSTSTSYRPYLCNNTSALTSQCSAITTSTQTLTFSGYTLDWDTMVGYGSNFGIRINCRRASRSTTAYFYIYGAEIEVDYTIPIYHTLTVEDNGYNVTPKGTTEVLEGSTQEIIIDETTLPTVTLDGVDISNQFTQKTLDTSYSGAPSASTYTGLSSGSSGVASAVGMTAENPYGDSLNWYGSSGATVDSQYAEYTFDLSSIPSNATDIKVACKVAGTAETTTYTHQAGGRYSVWALCCNGTEKSEQIYTTSGSVTVLEFTDTGSWTRSELNNLQLRHYVGYYGGSTNGATLSITYTIPGSATVYYYELAIGTSDHIIVLSSGTATDTLYIKAGGQFKAVEAVYKKVAGAWVEQTELAGLFDTNTTYVKRS